MRKIFLISLGILVLSIVTDAQYRINKTKYDTSNYKYLPGDRYNPPVGVLASLLVPGLGQAISGEVVRGLLFYGGYIGCAAMVFVSYGSGVGGPGLFLLGIAGMFTVFIYSVIDAPRVAKINNLAWRDKRKTGLSLKVSPYAGFLLGQKLPLGLSLKFNF
jgi:hypothetical protein